MKHVLALQRLMGISPSDGIQTSKGSKSGKKGEVGRWTMALSRASRSRTVVSRPSRRPSPLDVPEVLEKILKYVDSWTLHHSVVLVSHKWRSATLAIVPLRFSWIEETPVRELQRILAQGYQENMAGKGPKLRELHVRLDPSFPTPFHDRLASVFASGHNLTVLRIFHDRGSISLEPIFRHCPHLQTLYIRGGQSLQIQPPSVSFSALPPCADLNDGTARRSERETFLPFTLPTLTTFVLETLYISPMGVSDLAEAFPTLQELLLKDLHIFPSYNPSTPPQPVTAAELRAYWYCTHRDRTLPEQYLDALVRHRPTRAEIRHLRRIQFTLRGTSTLHRWHPLEMQRFFYSFEESVREWVLGYTDMCNLWTADPAILSDGWCMMPEPWPPLAPIPNRLTSLELVPNWDGGLDRQKDGWESLPEVGAMLHEFLCDAPSLRHLRARLLRYNVRYMDVFGAVELLGLHPTTGVGVAGQPSGANSSKPMRDTRLWACRDLETLHLGFQWKGEGPCSLSPQPLEERCARVLFGYLARVCPDLHYLDIGGEGLGLRLEEGFCMLSELTRLQVLKIECSVRHVDLKRRKPRRDELDWMAVEPVPRQALKGSFRKMRSVDEQDVTTAWIHRLTKEASMTQESKTSEQVSGVSEDRGDHNGFELIKGMSHRDHEMLRHLGSLNDVKMVLDAIRAKDEGLQKRHIWPFLYTIQVNRHSKQAEDKKTQQRIQWLRNMLI